MKLLNEEIVKRSYINCFLSTHKDKKGLLYNNINMRMNQIYLCREDLERMSKGMTCIIQQGKYPKMEEGDFFVYINNPIMAQEAINMGKNELIIPKEAVMPFIPYGIRDHFLRKKPIFLTLKDRLHENREGALFILLTREEFEFPNNIYIVDGESLYFVSRSEKKEDFRKFVRKDGLEVYAGIPLYTVMQRRIPGGEKFEIDNPEKAEIFKHHVISMGKLVGL